MRDGEGRGEAVECGRLGCNFGGLVVASGSTVEVVGLIGERYETDENIQMIMLSEDLCADKENLLHCISTSSL